MACLTLVGCEKSEPVKAAVDPAVEIRKIAEEAVKEISREEYWRRKEKTARDNLLEARAPGAVALAQVDLEKIMADHKDEKKGKINAVSTLEEITQRNPPYWPAVEKYQEAIRYSDGIDYFELNVCSLDKVMAKFGATP